MIDHIFHLATSSVSLVAVAVASTVNAVIAVLLGQILIFGAEVADGVLVTVALFVMATASGIAGWGLVMLVRISNIVSKLEVGHEDHERRLESGGL